VRALRHEDVAFFKGSGFDTTGRVFFHEGRVFRSIDTPEAAAACRRILDSPWIGEAFDAGLVKTWIAGDVTIAGAELVLEHERLPFIVRPAECTAQMHWLGAKVLVRLALLLGRHGITLKDAHPWNVAFHHGMPRFLDFGSLVGATATASWIDEFRRYYAVPIWLAAKGAQKLALEYRRQHLTGFGLRVFDSRILRDTAFFPFAIWRRSPELPHVLEKVDRWLDDHAPKPPGKERWASYLQSGEDASSVADGTPKQRFVYETLSAARPKTVLDCAANKGHFAELAARLGASVAAFDYEEYCVDECRRRAERHGLDISPALMDFRQPTPPHGLGLAYGSAYERFRSEILLALGLCHHLCIAQGLPVRLFCDICMEYSSDGVVLEYVDPADVHVSAWRSPIPPDYSFEHFGEYFSRKYPRRTEGAWPSDGGVVRRLAFFHR
jgi:hypothetical protein